MMNSEFLAIIDLKVEITLILVVGILASHLVYLFITFRLIFNPQELQVHLRHPRQPHRRPQGRVEPQHPRGVTAWRGQPQGPLTRT